MIHGDKVNAPHRKDAVGGLTEVATFHFVLNESSEDPQPILLAQVEYADGEVRAVPLDSLTHAG